MKTPDEIKKGLAACAELCTLTDDDCCSVCPYDDACRDAYEGKAAKDIVPGRIMMLDALHYIQQLETTHRTEYCEQADYDCIELGRARKRIAELKAKISENVAGWISVYTQMPKDGQRVLTVNGDGVIDVLYYDKEWPNIFCGCGGLLKVCNITHWMPLPTPPEEGTE